MTMIGKEIAERLFKLHTIAPPIKCFQILKLSVRFSPPTAGRTERKTEIFNWNINNNIIHSRIYCNRIAPYRGMSLNKFDRDKVDSFVEIAAMSFGMDETIARLVSIVELDVLLQYNAAISASLDYY